MEHDLSLNRGWFPERSLVGLRWWVVPLCVVVLPLFKPALWPLWIFLFLALGVGNAWLARALRHYPDSDDLRSIRAIATGVEWFTALSALALSSPDAATAAPVAMIVLFPVITFRYGIRELIIASATTCVVTGQSVHVARHE